MGAAIGFAAGLGLSCASPSELVCHERAIEELGCCPFCDPECAGSVDASCAEAHRKAGIGPDLAGDSGPPVGSSDSGPTHID